jgi:hypothetical protein
MALTGASFVIAPRQALSADTALGSAPAASGAGFGFFDSKERAALGSLADFVLPGSSALGAVDYIEGLLTAFDVDPPRIYAGGPFSGRTPFPNDDGSPSTNFPDNSFKSFLPLNRVQQFAWRLKLYGSAGVKGGGPNDALLGATKGLRDIFKSGVKEALSLALGATDRAAMTIVHPLLPGAFKDALQTLVLQSAFAAPEYGGNQGGKGWKSVHFEGDTLPLGFSHYDDRTQSYVERSDAPVSTLSPGPDPDRLGFFTRIFMRVIAAILGAGVSG